MLKNNQIINKSLVTQALSAVQIHCKYINLTNLIQIIRISNIPNWCYERVVFPQQRLMFKAPQEANLEVYTSEVASSILADRIPCIRLQIETPLEG